MERGAVVESSSRGLRRTGFLAALCALCVSAVVLLPVSGAPAKAAPKNKGLSGSGFTLQERGTNLGSEARDYLGNPKTEASVRKALKYLAETQNPDGSWGDQRYSSDVGIVGLCALSFMSAGHQPDRGPYGLVLRKATDYLVKHAQRTGLIFNPQAAAGPPMYGHGFATLALAELYG